jgi:hypothetical protein
MVFLNVTPKKSQLRLGKCYKLSPKYCGPFQILKKVGTMAYELELPSEWRIHNVFHVSFLRKFWFDLHKLLQDLSQAMVKGKIVAKSEHIFKTQMKKKGSHSFIEYIIKWKGYSFGNATWEKKGKLLKNFPNLKGIEDNTQFLRGGQCNNLLKSDKGQARKHDGSASEQVMEIQEV